jgi:hypothetical protein
MAAAAAAEALEIMGFNELPAELAEAFGGTPGMWEKAGKVAAGLTEEIIRNSDSEEKEQSAGNGMVVHQFQTPVKKKPRTDTISPFDSKMVTTRSHRNFLPPREPSIEEDVEMSSSNKRSVDHTDEVPVIPVPRAVSKITPDVFNIVLPLYISVALTTATGISSNNPMSVPAALADAKVTIVLNQLRHILGSFSARGCTHWSAMYNYYRITQMDVLITAYVRDKITGSGANYQSDNRNKYILGTYANDNPSSSNWTTVKDFCEMKGTKKVMLHTSGVHGVLPCNSIQFTYRPETWDLHVTESGVEERWTPVTAAPADPRYLHLGVVGAGGNNENAVVETYIEVRQHVQFREANESIYNSDEPVLPVPTEES